MKRKLRLPMKPFAKSLRRSPTLRLRVLKQFWQIWARKFLRRRPQIQRILSTLVCLKNWTARDLSMRCTGNLCSGFRVQGSGFFGLGTLKALQTFLRGVMEYSNTKHIIALFIAGYLQFIPSIAAAERIRTAVPGLNLNYLSIFSFELNPLAPKS